MQSIRTLLLSLAAATLIVASTASTAGPSGEKIMTMRIAGVIEVDATGRVADYDFETQVSDDIHKLLDKAIPEWRFEPPTHEGATGPVRGKMRITLAALPRESGDYAVRLDNVVFPGEGRRDVTLLTRPPTKGPDLPVNAIVPVEFRISPTGETLDVWVPQCSVLAKKPQTREANACAKLGKYLVRQFRDARFAFEGTPPNEPTSGVLPIQFNAYGAAGIEDTLGVWRTEWRSMYRQAPWKEPGAATIGASDTTGSRFVSDASTLKLLDGAIGRLL